MGREDENFKMPIMRKNDKYYIQKARVNKKLEPQ